MTQRKLFYALNVEGQKFYIDRLNTLNKNQLFLCPFCKKEVVPRMGQHMIWHFSHKDHECEYLCSEEEPEHKDIFSFSNNVTEKVEFSLDKNKYQCPICKRIRTKDNAVKYKGDMYMCKECYRNIDSEELAKIG